MFPFNRASRLLTSAAALSALALTAPAGADNHSKDGALMTKPAASHPLIPREALFGNPSRAGGQISPDGQYLSWLAPKDGVLNVWIAPRDKPDDAKVITTADDRPIRQYFWAPQSNAVLYVQDKGGDENFLLYKIDLETLEETALTPFEKTTVTITGTSETIKDKILVGLNNRNPQFHDVHMLDLNTGELTLVKENEGYAGFMSDDTLTLRMALAQNAAGGTDYFRVTDNVVDAEPFETTAMEDSLTATQPRFTLKTRQAAKKR